MPSHPISFLILSLIICSAALPTSNLHARELQWPDGPIPYQIQNLQVFIANPTSNLKSSLSFHFSDTNTGPVANETKCSRKISAGQDWADGTFYACNRDLENYPITYKFYRNESDGNEAWIEVHKTHYEPTAPSGFPGMVGSYYTYIGWNRTLFHQKVGQNGAWYRRNSSVLIPIRAIIA